MRASRHPAVMAWLLAVGVTLSTTIRVFAVPLSYSGGEYHQNFDSLPASGSVNLSNGNGPYDLDADPIFAFSLGGWQFAKTAGSGAAARFLVSDGASSTGAIYSYGAPADGDRSLGSLSSGTTISALGAVLSNGTGGALTQFTISFTGEQWRYGGSNIVNALAFEYAIGAGDVLNSTFTPATSLNFSSIQTNGSAPTGPLNGNDAANRAVVTATVSGFTWNPGDTLAIRWFDNNDVGNDDGLAIDDLTFSAQGGARNLVWSPGSFDWNNQPGNTNWREGASPTAFASGDNVTFTDVGVGVVTIDPAGVDPGSVTDSHNTGTLTLSGGPIRGNGSLVKTGGGELVLDSPNSYAGGTTLFSGVLTIAANDRLGAPAGALTFAGGGLKAAAPLDLARNISVDASGGTIDTNGFGVDLSGAFGATGPFTKAGNGNLILHSPINSSGEFKVTGGALVFAQDGGTQNLVASSAPFQFAGDIVIAGSTRVNVNGGIINGGGDVRLDAHLATLAVTGFPTANTLTIDNQLIINGRGLPGEFRARLGATSADAAQNQLVLKMGITGTGDVEFSTGAGGGGLIVLASPASYTGTTYINNASTGVVRTDVDQALPATTLLSFGDGVNTFSVGALDLNGTEQTVAGLTSNVLDPEIANGVVNSNASLATLRIVGNHTTSYTGAIGVPPVQVNLPVANDNIRVVLDASHTGHLTLAGVVRHTGGTIVNGGTLSIVGPQQYATLAEMSVGANGTANLYTDGGANLSVNVNGKLNAASTQHLASIDIGAGGKLTLLAGADKFLRTSRISVLSTGALDLADNDAIVDAAPAERLAVLTSLTQLLATGSAGLSWNGPGIRSSAATADATSLTALGIMLNDDGAGGPFRTSFAGESVDANAVLLKYTYYGDADLSGSVDGTDYALIDNGFNAGLHGWLNGDFDYSGQVDGTDYALIDNAFNSQGSPLGIAAVPEPATAPLAAVGILSGLLLRRTARRRGWSR